MAVCVPRGLCRLITAEGASIVEGGDRRAGPPAASEILEAIVRTGATQVAVLPSAHDAVLAASAAAADARAAGINAAVVPARSPVQALAALAVHDARRAFTDDMIAMAEAAGACRYAELTITDRQAVTMAGQCRPGDVLALVEGEVNLIGRDVAETSRQLLDRLLTAGGELVTLVVGDDAPDDLADGLCAHLRTRWPFVEVQCHHGGQPDHPLLVGVE